MNKENNLTQNNKIGKLTIKEMEFKTAKITGRIVLIVDLNQGGVTNVEEFKKD